jgi:hypothetical protein
MGDDRQGEDLQDSVPESSAEIVVAGANSLIAADRMIALTSSVTL